MTKSEFTAAKFDNMDRATADPRLSRLDCCLFWRMLSAADGQTGIIRRRQADLAEALRITRRAVQLCRDRLVEFGYLEPIGKRPGGYVSGYKMVTPERRTGVRLAAAEREKANLHSPIGEPAFAQRRTAIRTNTSLSSPLSILPSAHRETGAGAPRLRAGALGAPRQDNQAPGNDNRPPASGTPLKALGPLADREGELRDLLADRFRVLAMGEVIELTPDELVIATLTPSIGHMIQRDCQADLLAFTGANQLKIVIRMPEAPQLRRMQ